MLRIVSVWLPRWPIFRFLAAQARRSSPSRLRGEGRGEGQRHTSTFDPVAAPYPNPLPTEGWGEGINPRRPFVLTREAAGGLRVAALNAPAEALGLALGDPLADARAKAGEALQVRPADPAADAAALRHLALWATRYTPSVAPWGGDSGADGFFLDVTGSAHLFGGE